MRVASELLSPAPRVDTWVLATPTLGYRLTWLALGPPQPIVAILARGPRQAWHPWDPVAAWPGLAPEGHSQQEQQQVEPEGEPHIHLGEEAGGRVRSQPPVPPFFPPYRPWPGSAQPLDPTSCSLGSYQSDWWSLPHFRKGQPEITPCPHRAGTQPHLGLGAEVLSQ